MMTILRCAAMAAVVLAAPTVTAAEKRFGLTSFEAIELNADVTVEVVTRAPVSAVASGTQDALDRLTIETSNGRLVISERVFAGDENRKRPGTPTIIRVNAANLRSAAVAGAGSLSIDRLKGARVIVTLRGPGRVSVGNIAADRLAVGMIGNGAMTLGGSAKSAEMQLSGAGSVDAKTLVVDDLTTDSEGVGDHVFNASKTARITSRGIGRTVVLGKPACTVKNVGSGSVTCGAGK